MWWRRLVGLSIACTLGLLVGCGESSKTDSSQGNSGTGGASQGGAGGGNTDSIPLDMLGAAYARAQCAYLERCSSYPGLIAAKVPGGCIAIQTPTVEDDLVAKLSRALDSGRAEYDARAMAECLRRLESAGCADPVPDCEEAILGSVSAGGDCLADLECAGNAYCSAGEPIDEECSRWTCVPRGASGSCACDPGFTCGVDALGNATCQPGLAEGAACTVDGASCRGSLACVTAPAGGEGTCERFRDVALGEACDAVSRRCAADARCMIVGGTSEADFDYRCVSPAPSGGTCHIGLLDDCPMNEICPLGYADLVAGRHTAMCQPAPVAGEACNRDYYSGCLLPSLCSVAGVCETRRRLGEACSDEGSCVSESCVDGLCAVQTPC